MPPLAALGSPGNAHAPPTLHADRWLKDLKLKLIIAGVIILILIIIIVPIATTFNKTSVKS